MTTLIEALRQILGAPDFYVTSGDTQVLNYAAVIEYVVAALILLTVVSYVFRFVKWIFAR